MPEQANEQQLRDDALDELKQSRPGTPSGPAVRALVDYLAPIVQHRATRVVLTHGRGRVLGDPRSTVEEFVQLVFGKLFENQANVLRVWDPEAGLSLRNWVGRFTRLRVLDILRSGRRDPFRHQAQAPDEMERITGQAPESAVEAAELWGRVKECVEERQSEKGNRLFALLFLDERSVKEVQTETGLRPDAIFQWRRRLRLTLTDCLEHHSGPS